MSDLRSAVALTMALTACSPAPDETNGAETRAQAPAPPAAVDRLSEKPASAARAAVFTELDSAKCRVVEENKEEGPYWLRRCPGHAGWKLDWSESDLRQGLSLISPGRRETELRLSDLVANGAFNSLGKTVEWRGPSGAGPDAMIVRTNVANGAEPERPDISRLAVVRLIETPCLVAVVDPGPDQNEKARSIADGSMSSCVDE